MTNFITNGKLAWLQDKIKPAADGGFERFHLTNIAGWVSDSNLGNNQPHFPSNSYTGLALTQAPMYVEEDSTAGALMQDTPFTDSGMSAGTPGDNAEAWTAGVAALKSWVTTGTPEITSYQGYRPCYVDNTMQEFRKDLLGYSKSSTTAAGWTGTPGSPGFTPEPGFDGPGGFTTLPSTMAAWFDEEFIGLRSLGFDGIGLDTGTRVWDNAGGRANGTELGTVRPDGLVSSALVDYFDTWGIKPVFEGVGLDTWTQGAGKSAAPATDGRYGASAYWAYFGSWWGYEGLVNGEQVVTAHFDKASTGSVESPSGGYFFDTGLCGNAANAAAFGAEAEVHCIFQWGTGTYMTRIMQGTAGDAASGNGVGWTGMKQIMWDMHSAGAIVSLAGSMTTTIDGITPAMAMAFVLSLYTDPSQARPADSVSAEDWDTNSNGVWHIVTSSNTPDAAEDGFVQLSTLYNMASTNAGRGWYRTNNVASGRYYDVTGGEVPPVAVALWNETTQVWLGAGALDAYTPSNTNTVKYSTTPILGDGTAGNYMATADTEGDSVYVVFLTAYPTDIASWRAYDGPLGTSVYMTITFDDYSPVTDFTTGDALFDNFGIESIHSESYGFLMKFSSEALSNAFNETVDVFTVNGVTIPNADWNEISSSAIYSTTVAGIAARDALNAVGTSTQQSTVSWTLV